MICPKCKTNLESNASFCPVCGERLETIVQKNGVKIRKEYNPTIYILLDLFGLGFLLGTNDFYAGFYKMALFRLLSSVIGFVLGLTFGLGFLFFPGLSALIGFIELKGVLGKNIYLKTEKRYGLIPWM